MRIGRFNPSRGWRKLPRDPRVSPVAINIRPLRGQNRKQKIPMPTPEQLLKFLREHAGETFRPSEIMAELGIPMSEKRQVREMLRELTQGGEIGRFRRGAYSTPEQRKQLEGVLQVTRRGDGWVVVHGGEHEDISVPRRAIGPALHGDWVEVAVTGRFHNQVEGRIVRVVKHAHKTLVGQFLHTSEGALVVPKDPRIARRVRILRRHPRSQVPEGAWVIVKITHWSESQDDPLIGQLAEVLGADDEKGIDILVLLRGRGAATEFSPEVQSEAAALSGAISQEEIARRLDLRAQSIFTIDPETAKDFDDALSIELLGGGAVRLGVHIADVCHYVRPGTLIDAEAFDRATSIYPVDRVVPMLPNVLSDNLCSLRPREDRLTLSAFIEIGPDGKAGKTEIRESIIRSAFRLTYEEVQALFDEQPFPRAAEFAPIRAELLALRDLTRRLTRQRMERGALDLDLPETDVIFGSDGEVADVRRHPRFESHRLVEECMLLANEAVANLLARRTPSRSLSHPRRAGAKQPRTPAPNPAPLRRAAAQVERSSARTCSASSTASVAAKAPTIIMRMILRSLKKARYSERNAGHYGLASPCYCHFTSPIRRYPDLLVHRVVKEYLSPKGLSPALRQSLAEALPAMAAHTSEREERAAGIEREAVQIKSLEFIKPYIGEVIDGTVSGITDFGFFVQLDPWPIDGLVHVRTLEDDRYDFDEETFTLRGRRGGRIFHLADRVRVVIERVDPPAGQMDLRLMQKEQGRPARGKPGRGKPTQRRRK